jgi:hypothetical protein
MVHRFQFNRKHRKPVVIEGMRVDVAGGHITVVDLHGQLLMAFDEKELSSWYRVVDDPTPSS